ncbi:MAG: hypothetical protein LBR12_03375 [Opitutaceae bacterium]|nr:hypothetical protein [Opitutaceae bacterium]
MRARFPDEEFSDAGLELVHCGRHANARVFRWRGGGRDWIIKDFSSCAWLARALVGRWATRREFRALTRLKNLRGVAGNATRLGPCTVAYDFIPARQRPAQQ